MFRNSNSATHDAAEPNKIAWWKKAAFAAVVFVLFFLVLELVLYLCGVQTHFVAKDPYVGFEGQVPTYVEHRAEDNSRAKMQTAENKLKFFNEQTFARTKPAGTTRIFCLGGSTTFGRPYEDGTSYSGWLREMLPVADSNRNWEVINAGGISYASYRIATLMEELVQYEPDLFIVYCGHNEFLENRTYQGIIETPKPIRGMNVLLQKTHTFSAMANLFRSEPPPPAVRLPGEVETKLENAVGLEAYTRDEAMEEQIISHYRFNLVRMVEIARAAGAEIMFVTPASNLRHCSPFKSEFTEPLSNAKEVKFNTQLLVYRQAMGQKKIDEAVTAAKAMLELDENYAHARYWLATALDRAGRYDEARKEFAAACDKDICPLRASGRVIESMRGVAALYEIPIVDFKQFVDSEAPQNIPGDEIFLDHVHLTISGHAQLALLLMDEMETQGWVQPGDGWNEQSIAKIRDEVNGRVNQQQHGEAMRNIAQVLSWANKKEDAYRAARKAVELAPNDAEANYLAAALAFEHGEDDASLKYYQRLCARPLDERLPYAARAHLQYATILMDRGDLSRSHEQLKIALQRDPANKTGKGLLAKVLVMRARQLLQENQFKQAEPLLDQALEIDIQSSETWNYLGIVYWKTDRLQKAESCFRTATDGQREYAEAHNNLGSVLAESGKFKEAEIEFIMATKIKPDYELAEENLRQVRAKLRGG